MTENTETGAEPVKPRRVTQGEIILALLQRGSAGGSSVQLSRNAKGETQIEVVVRVDHDAGIDTPGEASAVAETVYDALTAKYPLGATNAA